MHSVSRKKVQALQGCTGQPHKRGGVSACKEGGRTGCLQGGKGDTQGGEPARSMQLSPFWQQYAEPHRWPAKGKNKKQQENISQKKAFSYDKFHFRGASYGTFISGEVRMMKTGLMFKRTFFMIF